jgi:hypothetical protein
LAENPSDNPDHFAVHIEHWTTGVSLVDGRIGLQKLHERGVNGFVIGRMSRTDVSNLFIVKVNTFLVSSERSSCRVS